VTRSSGGGQVQPLLTAPTDVTFQDRKGLYEVRAPPCTKHLCSQACAPVSAELCRHMLEQIFQSLTCMKPALAVIVPWTSFLSYTMTKQLTTHVSACADKSQWEGTLPSPSFLDARDQSA